MMSLVDDVAEKRESRNQDLTVLRHVGQDIRPAVKVEAVLDGVDTLLNGQKRASETLAVSSNQIPLAMRLIDDCRDLLTRHLRELRVLQLDRAGTGHHYLDEISSASNLLTNRLSHLIGSVRLPIHPGEVVATRRCGADDLPTREKSRAQQGTVSHGLAHLENAVIAGADITNRGDSHPESVASDRCDQVAPGPRQQRFGTLLDHDVRLLGQMGVHIYQARHQEPAFQIDYSSAGWGGGCCDVPVLDHEGRAIPDDAFSPVEEPGIDDCGHPRRWFWVR